MIFTINDKAEVKKSRIVRSVIRSDRRFSYEEVQEILTAGKGEYIDELSVLNSLAQTLREKRFAAGAIDFQQAEVRFRLDDDGKPLSVYFTESNESHQLIEEFMLLANRTVAETIGKKTAHNTPKTFVYRIHDQPDLEKMATLSRFVSKLGYKMRGAGRGNTSSSLNNLLRDIKGHKEQTVIETISLRTMQKAKYSTQNIGHFGLAFKYYTHFTSPIRRYPDLMVHRLLYSYLNNASSANIEFCEEQCKHSSLMERKAAEAERTSVKYKQAEFLSDKIGQEFPALISGVSKWGIYAEIEENKCEGMISLGSLQDDYYYLDEDNYQVIGRRYGRQYKLGDSIRIKVLRVDMEKKQMDFALIETEEPITPRNNKPEKKQTPKAKRKPAKKEKKTTKSKKTSRKKNK